jgi:uncharacterized protein (DUF1015 family)
VLQALVLTPLQEVLEEQWAEDERTGASGSPFSHNSKETMAVLQAALDGRLDLAFLLRSAPARQVIEFARAGHRMPPKSTNFVPKPPKGLLLHSLYSF